MEVPRETNRQAASGTRRVVASYTTYEEAERAVDRLSDAGFPVQRVTIVGEGLRFVESVTGRVGYGRAAVNGAVTGGFAGLLFGALFGLFSWIEPIVGTIALAFYGIVFGAVVGAFMGVIIHAVWGARRNFAAIAAVDADRYELAVDTDVAAKAEVLLELGPRARAEMTP